MGPSANGFVGLWTLIFMVPLQLALPTMPVWFCHIFSPKQLILFVWIFSQAVDGMMWTQSHKSKILAPLHLIPKYIAPVSMMNKLTLRTSNINRPTFIGPAILFTEDRTWVLLHCKIVLWIMTCCTYWWANRYPFFYWSPTNCCSMVPLSPILDDDLPTHCCSMVPLRSAPFMVSLILSWKWWIFSWCKMYPTQYALNLLKMSKIYETKIVAHCVLNRSITLLNFSNEIWYGWDCKYIISKSIRWSEEDWFICIPYGLQRQQPTDIITNQSSYMFDPLTLHLINQYMAGRIFRQVDKTPCNYCFLRKNSLPWV